MRNLIIAVFLAAGLTAPAAAQRLVLSPGLDSAVGMAARGRQGWQLNQVIRFGGFSTSKARRGWTKSYAIGFTMRFRNASQKLSFTQKTPEGLEADVLAVSRFSATELDMARGFLSLQLASRNTFAGTIVPGGVTEKAWDFVLFQPEGSLGRDAVCGEAYSDSAGTIVVRGIRELEGMPRWMQAANFGYEFHRDGRPIAAISIMNSGKVWMLPGLDADTRLIVAALSSALLLRQDVSQSGPARLP